MCSLKYCCGQFSLKIIWKSKASKSWESSANAAINPRKQFRLSASEWLASEIDKEPPAVILKTSEKAFEINEQGLKEKDKKLGQKCKTVNSLKLISQLTRNNRLGLSCVSNQCGGRRWDLAKVRF